MKKKESIALKQVNPDIILQLFLFELRSPFFYLSETRKAKLILHHTTFFFTSGDYDGHGVPRLFPSLARYAPAEVADDREKQEHFMEGLEDYIQYALLNLRFDDFNHLVDSALNTERKHREMEDKKRKITPVVFGSSTHPCFQPPQQQQYRPP